MNGHDLIARNAQQRQILEISKQCIRTHLQGPSTRQALMIDGEWGSGKTHFIEHEVKKIVESELGTQCIIVSAYGASSLNDLNSRIQEQALALLPVIKSVYTFMGSAAEGLQKVAGIAANVEMVKNAVESTGFLLTDRILGFAVNRVIKEGKCVLIIDDLERANLGPKELFGCINYYVEERALKVIVGCNKIELLKKSERDEYKDVIEKTISLRISSPYLSFHVVPAILGSMDSIVPISKKFLEDKFNVVFPIIDKSNCRNFRSVRMIFYYFTIFDLSLYDSSAWGQFPDSDLRDNYREQALRLIAAMVIESKQISYGDIHSYVDNQSILRFSVIAHARQQTAQEKELSSEMSRVQDVYFDGGYCIIQPGYMEKLFETGYLDEQSLVDDVKEKYPSRMSTDDQAIATVSSWAVYQISDQDAESFIDIVLKLVQENKVSAKTLLRTYVNIITLCDKEGTAKTATEIDQIYNRAIEKNTFIDLESFDRGEYVYTDKRVIQLLSALDKRRKGEHLEKELALLPTSASEGGATSAFNKVREVMMKRKIGGLFQSVTPDEMWCSVKGMGNEELDELVQNIYSIFINGDRVSDLTAIDMQFFSESLTYLELLVKEKHGIRRFQLNRLIGCVREISCALGVA